jgi:hypothetical protein
MDVPNNHCRLSLERSLLARSGKPNLVIVYPKAVAEIKI